MLGGFFSKGKAQQRVNFYGTIENNINFFREDSLIGASGIPQYNNNDIGGEIWVDLHAGYKGYQAGIRLDAFQKSNLLNPTGSYSAQGIGRFYLKKDYNRFGIELGYLYDQIGSGIIFRSYESRSQLLDYALVGGKVHWDIIDNLQIRGFYGRQKRQFDIYDSDIRGLNLDGFFELGKEKSLTLSPGIGYINRVLSQDNIDQVVDVLRTYVEEDRELPKYNAYLFSLYNTLGYKSLSWYVEAAYKTPELFFDPNATRTELTGREVFGKYIRRAGSVYYSSLSIAVKNLGITLEGKRTSNFNFRTNPLLRQNDGLISFIPPMNRQSTYRMLARYNPATQDLSEMAWQFDIKHRINSSWSWEVNVSDIYTLDSDPLFREFYFSFLYKKKRKWQYRSGIQFLVYNQEVYEVKPEVPLLEATTVFADFLYRFNTRNSLRTEMQYMYTQEDYGSWLFGLVEASLGKYVILEISGMYNISPGPASPEDPDTEIKEKILYPTIGIQLRKGSKRISFRYVKQVEGVICTGGICRLEPAFSGFRMNTYVQF